LLRLAAAGVLALLSGPLAAQTAPAERVTESIGRVFGAGVTIEAVLVDSTEVFRISRENTLLGFAEVRNVKGKERPITYLVAVDTSGATRDIDILVYRESQGGEIANDAWRKQFRGKTAADPLQVGKDIRNISGATISSNAVTRSMRQALARLAAWRAEGKLP
jgi:Na+-translocating ferredoxin:NAD+ oxidoreductase RnfG subunit